MSVYDELQDFSMLDEDEDLEGDDDEEGTPEGFDKGYEEEEE